MNSNQFDKDQSNEFDRTDVESETTKVETETNSELSNIEVQESSEVDTVQTAKVQESPQVDAVQSVNGEVEKDNHLYAGLYAGFWTRFWAYLLDLIVIGSINRMIINPVFRALDISLFEEGIFSPMTIATAVVFYLYFVLMTKFLGQTLGKMVFGLKVVELDGKRLTWGTVIFREWIGRFISATLLVLYVVVAFTKKKQGLHDLFADTTVIYEPR